MGLLGTRIDIASPFFRATRDDAVILRQQVEMVLDTRQGTYWTAPDYGLALDEFVNADVSVETFGRLAGRIKSALLGSAFFRQATIAVGVKTHERRPEGLALKFAAKIALPDGEPIPVTIETSAAGVTVGA